MNFCISLLNQLVIRESRSLNNLFGIINRNHFNSLVNLLDMHPYMQICLSIIILGKQHYRFTSSAKKISRIYTIVRSMGSRSPTTIQNPNNWISLRVIIMIA